MSCCTRPLRRSFWNSTCPFSSTDVTMWESFFSIARHRYLCHIVWLESSSNVLKVHTFVLLINSNCVLNVCSYNVMLWLCLCFYVLLQRDYVSWEEIRKPFIDRQKNDVRNLCPPVHVKASTLHVKCILVIVKAISEPPSLSSKTLSGATSYTRHTTLSSHFIWNYRILDRYIRGNHHPSPNIRTCVAFHIHSQDGLIKAYSYYISMASN